MSDDSNAFVGKAIAFPWQSFAPSYFHPFCPICDSPCTWLLIFRRGSPHLLFLHLSLWFLYLQIHVLMRTESASPEDDFEGKGRSSRHPIDLPAKVDAKVLCQVYDSSIYHPEKRWDHSPFGKKRVRSAFEFYRLYVIFSTSNLDKTDLFFPSVSLGLFW